MADKTESSQSVTNLRKKDRAAEIANTFEWLLTAFILAFVFRAFVMEAFRIPTGSMADTLMGAHFRLRCPQCGYPYELGFIPERYNLPQDAVPGYKVRPNQSRCPSCGYFPPIDNGMSVSNGDRILVLKCIYQFFEPKRWDVVVFKNPLDPQINFIKRLIGKPGEKLEIIDGDIYINDEIARKPAKVQNELWMPVYDNDYQPINPRMGSFNSHSWQQPFKNVIGSNWQFSKDQPTVFKLDSPGTQTNYLFYDSAVGNNFRTAYAYDNVDSYPSMPYCSDLKSRFYVETTSAAGEIGVSLSKYQTVYQGWVDFSGKMAITKNVTGKQPVKLAEKDIKFTADGKPMLFSFANVDHELILEAGGEKLSYDMGRSAESMGERKSNIEPQMQIFGSGNLAISHVALYRDIHYTDAEGMGRATEGKAITLDPDQFFMLGDNSPNSSDSRYWDRDGIGNNGKKYRAGIVPREYLVGKAAFVYWPSGFEIPWPNWLEEQMARSSYNNGLARVGYWIMSFKCIPNVGKMRFIYGGSNDSNSL